VRSSEQKKSESARESAREFEYRSPIIDKRHVTPTTTITPESRSTIEDARRAMFYEERADAQRDQYALTLCSRAHPSARVRTATDGEERLCAVIQRRMR